MKDDIKSFCRGFGRVTLVMAAIVLAFVAVAYAASILLDLCAAVEAMVYPERDGNPGMLGFAMFMVSAASIVNGIICGMLEVYEQRRLKEIEEGRL